MYGANELIGEAIAKLAAQPVVFTASDVAAHSDVSGEDMAVAGALQAECAAGSISALDGAQCGVPFGRCYLGKTPVERWWVASTLRWAKAGVVCLESSALARAMALAFDTRQWAAPPGSLLAVGRQWGMVDDGYASDTFVFPWATVIHYNPQFQTIFRLLSTISELPALEVMVEEALSTLTDREAGIMRARCGLDTGHRITLEQLGTRYGVTRERIRQIEQKARRKLRHPSRREHLYLAFASDFAQSGYSLLFPESSPAPHRAFVMDVLDLKTARIPELGFRFMVPEKAVSPYRNSLQDSDTYMEAVIASSRFSAMDNLQFLSQRDSELISDAEQSYLAAQIAKKRPRRYMLREALRVLGRAAHFTEIADLCNRMFPDNQASVHNWHAALGRPDSAALGIVWIGVKGTYGLEEHDYTRPEVGIFEAVARIVEEKFAATQRPVSEETVLAELDKYRREFKRGSVTIALSINDRLMSVRSGQFVPKASGEDHPAAAKLPEYDIDAAFAAFSSDSDD